MGPLTKLPRQAQRPEFNPQNRLRDGEIEPDRTSSSKLSPELYINNTASASPMIIANYFQRNGKNKIKQDLKSFRKRSQ